MPFAISVENVIKSFEESRIIDDVSFNLAPRTSSVIVGPAASGKSLLLKCILGLIPIDSGNISINGRTGISRLKEMHNVGVMFQENALFDSLTVSENIAFRLINQKRISEKTAKIICNSSKFVALNAQINAANIGYHSMRKYKNINCLIINEKEIMTYEDLSERLTSALTHEISFSNTSRENNILIQTFVFRYEEWSIDKLYIVEFGVFPNAA